MRLLFFRCRKNNNRNLLGHLYVKHCIEIVSHDRDYSYVDVHEQAMLSTKAKETPTEKRAESQKNSLR